MSALCNEIPGILIAPADYVFEELVSSLQSHDDLKNIIILLLLLITFQYYRIVKN